MSDSYNTGGYPWCDLVRITPVYTKQPDSMETFKKASGLRRIGAWLIDMVFVYLYIIVLFAASMGLNEVWPFHEAMGESYVLRHLVSFFTLTLPMILYFVFMEHSSRQGTFGKSRLRLRVVSLYGSTADRKHLLIRNAVKFLPWEIAHTTIHLNPEFISMGPTTVAAWIGGVVIPYGLALLFVGLIFARSDGRTVYEWASGTRVVRTE